MAAQVYSPFRKKHWSIIFPVNTLGCVDLIFTLLLQLGWNLDEAEIAQVGNNCKLALTLYKSPFNNCPFSIKQRVWLQYLLFPASDVIKFAKD